MNTLDKFQPNKVIVQRKTGNIRVRKGNPEALIPDNLGLEEEWSFIEHLGDLVWTEWRPILVVEHDA